MDELIKFAKQHRNYYNVFISFGFVLSDGFVPAVEMIEKYMKNKTKQEKESAFGGIM